MSKKVFEFLIFDRDKMLCRMCNKIARVAHQIVNKNAFPHGGFVMENGISLCNDCFQKASENIYSASQLYDIIGFSFIEALEADEEDNK